MSSVQTGGNLEWHNAGPLTTTWTAPQSCATEPVIRSGLAVPQVPWFPRLIVDGCDGWNIPDECRPNGGKVNEIYENVDLAVEVTTAHYYFPGIQCPDNWVTVGIAAMNNGAPSVSGIFQPTAFTEGAPGETTNFPAANFQANMLTSILEPTQTAVACCPRYIGPGPGEGNELRTETFEFAGKTTTATQRKFPFTTGWRDTSDAVTYIIPFDSSGLPEETASGLAAFGEEPWESGVAVVQAIYLVNSGDGYDEKNGNGNDNEEATTNSPVSTGGGQHSAAHALMPNRWAAIGTILGAWGVSVIVGVALLATR
ncbi:predicted protein [Verticillium alfalfae VaMs.102]|uniref:Predicted protein n=1 Tax=Verticillium alfalfae (strain VaMs.102 / ATCC MYA-4576 / FGSC 10136) TaxID=526221 RepID=C9SBB6_VERA1|nr:predicted protein [Verticillium alfalfae VaMs.102]EEY16398.1 predicted protein [Verticillium alfalfae VaMs.102]